MPRQLNRYDCRTFIMISIYLMSMGVQLQHSLYDQYGVSLQQLQRSIAFNLTQANKLTPSVSVTQHLTIQRRAIAAQARSKRKKRRENLGWCQATRKQGLMSAQPFNSFALLTNLLSTRNSVQNPSRTDIIPNSRSIKCSVALKESSKKRQGNNM